MTGTDWRLRLDLALTAAFAPTSGSPLRSWNTPTQDGFRRTCAEAVGFMASARRTGHAAQVFEIEKPGARKEPMKWRVAYKVRFKGRSTSGPCTRTVTVRRFPSQDLLRSFDADMHWGTASDLAEVVEKAMADDLAPFLAEVRAGYEEARTDGALQARLREQDLKMQGKRKKQAAERLAVTFGDLMAHGWTREDVLTVWKEAEVREVMDR
jgi:hypothetical protein